MINGSLTAILDGTLEYAISIYIEPTENKDELLAKFSGDKVKLVQWLRARAFSNGAPIQDIKPKSAESKKEPLVPVLKKKRASKKPTPEDNKNQNSIF